MMTFSTLCNFLWTPLFKIRNVGGLSVRQARQLSYFTYKIFQRIAFSQGSTLVGFNLKSNQPGISNKHTNARVGTLATC